MDGLETGWLLLDCELMPWSAKAEDLLRTQYAAVGAAARTALPVAVSALEAASASGVDVAALLDRTRGRFVNPEAFTEAYRQYCWSTDGLTGIRVAPFQLLATEGATYHDREHAWHLAVADRLVEACPEVMQTTRRLYVDTPESESVDEAWSRMRTCTETGDGSSLTTRTELGQPLLDLRQSSVC